MEDKKQTLNERMKVYENEFKIILPKDSYVMIRLDGRGFSKYTKNLNKPFDVDFSDAMNETAKYLGEQFNPKFVYTQSDEITMCLGGVNDEKTQLMFGGSLQKLCSLTASAATGKFNEVRSMQYTNNLLRGDGLTKDKLDNLDYPKLAQFDSRVSLLPSDVEVFNNILWRQRDCIKNSVSMAAQELFSHKELMGINTTDLKVKLLDAGVVWDDYPTKFKRGVLSYRETYYKNVEPDVDFGLQSSTCATVTRTRWVIDNEIPYLGDDREYLMKLISPTVEL